MKTLVGAKLAFGRPETAALLRRVATRAGLFIEQEFDLNIAPPDPAGCQLLLFEQADLTGVGARVYSLAGANPEMLLVVVVPFPRARIERDLLDSGAFDVVDLGPELEAQLAHTVAGARRVIAAHQERQRLSASLAHQDKIAALGVLAAGVSHEINNPCAAILANMTTLREQLEAVVNKPRFQRLGAVEEFLSEGLEALSDCIGAAGRITAIVKTLNVYARRPENEEPAPLDVNDEINTVLRLIGREVKAQARFELDLAKDLPSVVGPPNSITQITTNLVMNALQALEAVPAGERRIRIATAFDDEHVMLEVADNGPGMPPDLLSRIFDPFFTTKTAGKGTGLGLSITRELVRQTGGEIFVDSEPGQGARFSVFFERRQVPQPGVVEPGRAIVPSSERLRLLLVDDDLMLLRSLERSLHNHFEVVAAGGVAEARDILAADAQFDAVVTDVIMPEANGLDLYLHLLDAHPKLAERTLFLTGGITSPTLRKAIVATGRELISKPVELAALARAVRALAHPERTTPVNGHQLRLVRGK